MRLSDIQPIKLQHMPGGICAIDWHILPLPLGLTGGDLICKSSAPGEPAVSKLTRIFIFVLTVSFLWISSLAATPDPAALLSPPLSSANGKSLPSSMIGYRDTCCPRSAGRSCWATIAEPTPVLR